MAEIVDLDELVPDDIEFKYRGKTYTLPGDPPNEVVLELIKQYQRMFGLDQEPDTKKKLTRAQEEEQTDASIAAIKGVLLDLFRLKDPTVEQWPFGIYSTQHIARRVLIQLGLLKLAETGEGADLPEPGEDGPPTRPRRRRSASSS